MQLSGKKLTTAILAGLMGATMFGSSVFADTTLENVQTLANQNSDHIADLTNRVSKLDGRVSKLETDSSKDTYSKDEVDSKLAGKANQSDVNTNRDNISKNTSAIDKEVKDRDAADKTLQSNIDTEAKARQAAVATIQGQQDGQDAQIAKNKKDITANAGSIEKNTKDIEANSDKLADHESRIKGNETNIANNAESITKEINTRMDVDNALQQNINQAVADYKDADRTLQSQITSNTQDIDTTKTYVEQNMQGISDNRGSIGKINGILNGTDGTGNSGLIGKVDALQNDSATVKKAATLINDNKDAIEKVGDYENRLQTVENTSNNNAAAIGFKPNGTAVKDGNFVHALSQNTEDPSKSVTIGTNLNALDTQLAGVTQAAEGAKLTLDDKGNLQTTTTTVNADGSLTTTNDKVESISVTKNVNAGDSVNASKNINAGGAVNAGSVNSRGDITAKGTISAKGNITSDKTIKGKDLIADNSITSNGTISAEGNIVSNKTVKGQDVIADNSITSNGTISAKGNITSDSTIRGKDVIANNNVTAHNQVVGENGVIDQTTKDSTAVKGTNTVGQNLNALDERVTNVKNYLQDETEKNYVSKGMYNRDTGVQDGNVVKESQTVGENLQGLDTALGKETYARIWADKAQDNVIKQVNDNLVSSVNTINKNVAAGFKALSAVDLQEAQTRDAADQKLQKNIDAEADARDKADKKEAATRQAADQNLQNQINNNGTSINDLYGRYSSLKTDINKVGARSAALAGLHPLDFDPANKLNFAVASGSFKGENSVALGAFYRPNENIMFSAASTMGDSDNAYTFGLSFKIGPSSAKTKTTSPDAEELYKVVGQLQDQLAAQQKEIEQLKANKAK